MTAHAWYIENRVAFVARSLEPGEERTFRDHLVRCDECAREVERLERELGWLPMGAAPVAPPPGFARRMAAEVLDRPSYWRRRLPLAAAAGMALVAAGTALSARNEDRDLRALLSARESRGAPRIRSRCSADEHGLQTQISMDGHRQAAGLQDAVSHRGA
jgi:hypothetical protein